MTSYAPHATRAPAQPPLGTLTVIMGPMFSGKSTQLVALLRDHAARGAHVVALRPARDTRDAERSLVTHDGDRWPALRVTHAEDIPSALPAGVGVVGIEESNMFGDSLVDVCRHLMGEGLHVICAGLNLDYRARPFDPIPTLAAFADQVITRTARCARCVAPARCSYRLTGDDLLILPGGADHYAPLCLRCFDAANGGALHRAVPQPGGVGVAR